MLSKSVLITFIFSQTLGPWVFKYLSSIAYCKRHNSKKTRRHNIKHLSIYLQQQITTKLNNYIVLWHKRLQYKIKANNFNKVYKKFLSFKRTCSINHLSAFIVKKINISSQAINMTSKLKNI